MTDKTQPEAGSTHIIRYALELGLLWIDGDGRDKVREALDALDALDVKLASIGAGGVQALSAAPAVPNGDELRRIARSARTSASDDASPTEYVLAGWKAAMLAASPTPPAEQQAAKETSGGFHVWRDISTAPKDGSRFVATGHNYGLYSEVRHTCVAQWFRGCWMEASDWNETSELKYLTHWIPLPPPPDDATAPAEQAAPKAAPLRDDVVKDAERWRMVALIGKEVMLHPEKRTQAAAVKAYMDATHSGLDLTGAVDAALAAQGGK